MGTSKGTQMVRHQASPPKARHGEAYVGATRAEQARQEEESPAGSAEAAPVVLAPEEPI